MKILFVLTRYPGYGGIETVTNTITTALIEQGIECSIIAYTYQECPTQVNPKIQIIHFPSEKYYCKKNLNFLRDLIKQNNYNRIIYQDSYAPSEKLIIKICDEFKIPLYVFEHNSPFIRLGFGSHENSINLILRSLFKPYIRLREYNRRNRLLNACSRYVLLSKSFIPEFCNLAKIDQNHPKLYIINNPLPLQNIIKQEYHKEKIILFVGRMVEGKGIFKMADIWQILSKYLPEWKMIYVGDGPDKSKLQQICHAKNIPNIFFTGFDDPWPYYAKSSIFLMASNKEGWGMTLVEAMSCGCVPIAEKSYSSISDIIDTNINGILLNVNTSVSHWAKVILNIIQDKERYKSLSEQAIVKSILFSIDKIIHRWLDLLNIIPSH